MSVQSRLESESPGLLESVWRYRWSSLLVVAAFGVAGLAASHLIPARYVAKTSLALAEPTGSVFDEGGALPGDFDRYMSRQATVARSASVMRRAAQNLDDAPSYKTLKQSVGATAAEDLITISAEAGSARQARSWADAVADAYQDFRAAQTRANATQAVAAIDASRTALRQSLFDISNRLAASPGNRGIQAELDVASDAMAELDKRANEISVNAKVFGSGVQFVEPAQLPAGPTQPTPLKNAAAAVLLGCLVALATAWLRAARRPVVEHSGLPRALFDAPLLGRVAELRSRAERFVLTDLRAMPAEPYEAVMTSLDLVQGSGVVMVTSAGPGEGKTVTVASLAAAAARAGRRVVVVDADTRSHELGRLMGLHDMAPGFTEIARGDLPVSDAVVTVQLSPAVAVAAVSAGAPSETVFLYRSDHVGKALAALRQEYDLVLVDCPSVLSGSEVLSLAPEADSLLLVVSKGAPLRHLEALRERLELVPTPVIGYVFTRTGEIAGMDARSAFSDFPATAPDLPSSPPSAQRTANGNGNGNGERRAPAAATTAFAEWVAEQTAAGRPLS